MAEYSEFMLYAEIEGRIVSTVFGFVESNDSITVSMVATDENYRHNRIASSLLAELESRLLTRGHHLLVLGSVESAEGFYLKCGYNPYLFIQTHPPLTLDDLRSINDTFDEAFSYDDGIDIRLCLNTDGIDKELQHKYDNTFSNCYTNTLFMKRI
jgi:ribosomal protein S18 acetylase RimI-like enzyme